MNHIQVTEIFKALKNVYALKSPGPDKIPPIFLKNLAKVLTSLLFWLFSKSLESQEFELGDLPENMEKKSVGKCERARNLGVISDSKLAFVDHYNTIVHRVYNMLGFIKYFHTIKTLYIAYVRSIVEYCNIVWFPFQIAHEK